MAQDVPGFYDAFWSQQRVADPACSAQERVRLTKVTSVLERIAGGTRALSILDLGCGTGWITARLSRFGTVTGVDFSERAIEIARKTFSADTVRFVVRDFLSSPLDDLGPFDAVVATEVIEHVPDPLKSRFVEMCHRVLRPNGVFILSTPNGGVGERYWSTRVADVALWRQPVEDWVTRNGMYELLSGGFEVVESHSFIFDFDNRGLYRLIGSHTVQGLLGSVGLWRPVERYLERHWFGLYGFFVAQKAVTARSR